MIRRALEALAERLIDRDWLHERRKQEVLSRRHTQHIARQTRLDPPFELDGFPQKRTRKAGEQCT